MAFLLPLPDPSCPLLQQPALHGRGREKWDLACSQPCSPNGEQIALFAWAFSKHNIS